MKDIIKQRLSFVLKYMIGLVLLGWILWRVDRREMVRMLLSFDFDVLALLLSIAFVNLAVQFYRWKYLIEQHSTQYEARDLLPSFFAGFAFRLMLPGGHAEITKIFLLPGQKRGKVVAFGIEKFFQTYIKLFSVLIALPFVFHEYRIPLWSLAIISVIAYLFLPLFFRLSFMKRFQEKDINYKRVLPGTLLFTVIIFAALIMQYYLLLNDVQSIAFLDTLLSVIFIWGAGLLPITVSGLGVRENLAVFFFAKYGIPAYTAVGVSLLIFFINAIIPAMIGVVFILKKRKDLSDAGPAIRSFTKNIYNQGRQRINGRKKSSEIIDLED